MNNLTEETKLRVLVLADFISAYGLSRSVAEDLADQLEKRGHCVLRSSTKRNRFARLVDRMYTAIRQRGKYAMAYVDVFSGSAFTCAELTCWALRLAGRPYVLTLRGGGLPRYAERWPSRVRRLLASAHAVTVPSKFLLEKMQPYCDGLILLSNPLAIERYQFRPRRQAAPRLAWLRAFSKIYNPSMAAEVVALLKKDFPEVRLLMFGADKADGSRRECKATAVRLGVLDRIEFRGCVPKTDVPTVLQEADIFINTTNVDNTPVSVLEAMACGLCVVSTDVGGIPYLLSHQHDALLTPPRDPQEMAAAVKRVLLDNELAERLSCNARRTAEQFDWPPILTQWERLLAQTDAE